MLLCKTGHGLPREAKKISTETWTDVAIEMWKGMNCHHSSLIIYLINLNKTMKGYSWDRLKFFRSTNVRAYVGTTRFWPSKYTSLNQWYHSCYDLAGLVFFDWLKQLLEDARNFVVPSYACKQKVLKELKCFVRASKVTIKGPKIHIIHIFSSRHGSRRK